MYIIRNNKQFTTEASNTNQLGKIQIIYTRIGKNEDYIEFKLINQIIE